MKEFKMITNAFGKRQNHKVAVEGNAVLVWDSVAKHYTTCHSMSDAAKKAAIKKASK